jgi:glycosyltransferase involved in cell wall biosynthesis
VNPTIAYLAGTFPSRSETFVYREVRELRRRGWTVIAATLNRPAVSPEDKFDDLTRELVTVYDGSMFGAVTVELLLHPIRSIGTISMAATDALCPSESMGLGARLKLIGQAMAGMKLARSLRQKGVSHIHCHFAHAPATVGMYAARHLGIPFSFTGHANDLFQRRALLKRKLSRARFVSCISQWHREFYREAAPDDDDKYSIIRCGVNVSEWSPKTVDERKEEPLRVLTVCRLVEKKGVDTLVRAMAKMKRPAVLTVAGDGPERARLEQLAKELKIEKNIRWLGAVDNETVRRLMGESDVFGLPCRTDSNGDRDGVPVVLMEAMACGLTAISGDLPAIRELVEHKVDGLLVAENDDAGLAKELDGLTTDSRRHFGKVARAKVENEFSLALNVDRLERAMKRTK